MSVNLRSLVFSLFAFVLAGAAVAQVAATVTVRDASGAVIGTVYLEQVDAGTRVTMVIDGVTPGAHGFHVHELGSCDASTNAEGQVVPFGAAGSHFDPHATGSHAGPHAGHHVGHAGDLPNLVADELGVGSLTFVTDRITLEGELGVIGRSLVLHANADNYSDEPPLGGSGGRIACGLILAAAR